MFLRKTTTLVLCVLFLSGCSSIPLLRDKEPYGDLYRRIPYRTEGRYRVLDLFYATSRKIDGSIKTSKAFRPTMGDKISYGAVDVKIDPRLTIGTMLPHWYKKRGIIGVQNIELLKEAEFMKELKNTIEASPHKSLLVIVSGYKDGFEYTAIKAAYFSYLLDVDTPVLFFDWPGDQSVSPWGYLKAEKFAKESGKHMGCLLAKIEREINPAKLWITASSLGSQVACSAFEEMYKYEDMKDEDLEIDHVILAAPDVSKKEFDENFQKEIAALSKRLTTYISSDDKALLMSELIDGKKKLGRRKIKAEKHAQFDETKSMLYIKSMMPDKVAVIDVTPINRASYKHGYYLEAPEFFDDFYLRVLESPPHVNRLLYLLKTKDKIDYWVLQGRK